jgi:integrase
MALVFNNNGTWWTYLGRKEGKGHRASTGLSVKAPTLTIAKDNKKSAEAIAARLRAEWHLNAHGLTAAPALEAPTFATHADTWEQEWGRLQRGYEGRIKYRIKALKKVFGDYRLSDITPELVHTWRTQRLLAGTAPRTINRDVDLLKSMLAKGVPRYYLESPIRRMLRLKAAPVITKTLDPEAEKKILDALSPEDTAIFLIALDGLVRLGDVLSLKWGDVLADGMIRLVRDKTNKQHLVPLSTRAQAALAAIEPKDREGTQRVFPYATTALSGERQWVGSYVHRLKTICKRIDVPFGRKNGGPNFHAATRHTGATRLTAAGVDLRTVQEIGGWKNISMLQRYVHPDAAGLKAAVEKIAST